MGLPDLNPKEFFEHLDKAYQTLSPKSKKIIPREKFSAFSLAIILIREGVVESLLLEMIYSDEFIKIFNREIIGYSVNFRCSQNFIIIHKNNSSKFKRVMEAMSYIVNNPKINFILFDVIMNLIGYGYCKKEPEHRSMKFLTLIDNTTKCRFKEIKYCVCYCSKDHLITRYILDKSNEIMEIISDKFRFILTEESFD